MNRERFSSGLASQNNYRRQKAETIGYNETFVLADYLQKFVLQKGVLSYVVVPFVHNHYEVR